MIDIVDDSASHRIANGIKNRAYFHLLPPQPPPALADLLAAAAIAPLAGAARAAMSAIESICWSFWGARSRPGQSRTGQYSQRDHVCRQKCLLKHALGEHEVDLAGVEELVGGQRHDRLVKQETVGRAYERGGGEGTILAVDVGEGLNGRYATRVLSEVVIGVDDEGK